MTKLEAKQVLTGMMHLRYFPVAPEAIANLAELLVELTHGDKARAQWLVHECATTLDDYPGPATMREMYSKHFPPAGTAEADYAIDKAAYEPITDAEREAWAAFNAKYLSTPPKPIPVPPPMRSRLTERDLDDAKRRAAGDRD